MCSTGQLRALDKLRVERKLTEGQYNDVKRDLGWEKARVVDVVQVRPLEVLPGGSFDGFFHGDMREKYVETGRARGEEVLGKRGWFGA